MLKRLDCSEGGYESLERQWSDECARYGEGFSDYAALKLSMHAKSAARFLKTKITVFLHYGRVMLSHQLCT